MDQQKLAGLPNGGSVWVRGSIKATDQLKWPKIAFLTSKQV